MSDLDLDDEIPAADRKVGKNDNSSDEQYQLTAGEMRDALGPSTISAVRLQRNAWRVLAHNRRASRWRPSCAADAEPMGQPMQKRHQSSLPKLLAPGCDSCLAHRHHT